MSFWSGGGNADHQLQVSGEASDNGQVLNFLRRISLGAKNPEPLLADLDELDENAPNEKNGW